MLDLIKKSLLASLGAAVVTRDKIREATRLFVEEGKLTTEESEKLGEELVQSGRQEWDEIQARITELVKKGLDNLDISSKSEFQALAARLENLEKRVSMMEEDRAKSKETGQGH